MDQRRMEYSFRWKGNRFSRVELEIWSAVFCLCGACHKDKEIVRMPSPMDMAEVVVANVASLEKPGPGADTTLRLMNGRSYTLSRSDRRIGVWSDILRDRQKTGKPVYVEANSATRQIQNVFLPSRRIVESLNDAPEEKRLRVVLLMAPSVYFLDATRSDFQSIRKLLEDSRRRKTEMLVTSHPETLEILDVRKP